MFDLATNEVSECNLPNVKSPITVPEDYVAEYRVPHVHRPSIQPTISTVSHRAKGPVESNLPQPPSLMRSLFSATNSAPEISEAP